MRVLVTRAGAEAAPFGQQLEKLGCTPLIASMMEMELQTDPFDTSAVSAIVTTSQQAIKALAEATDDRDVILYTVGPASGRVAEELGFKNVRVAAGTGKAMVGYIRRTMGPAEKPLAYFRGDVVKQPIGKDLGRAGYNVLPHIAYKTKPITEFPAEVLSEFDKETPPEVATFMSIRTYRLFANALEKSGNEDKTAQMTAICISPAVSDFVRERRWKKVITADEPDVRAVFAEIKKLMDGEAA